MKEKSQEPDEKSIKIWRTMYRFYARVKYGKPLHIKQVATADKSFTDETCLLRIGKSPLEGRVSFGHVSSREETCLFRGRHVSSEGRHVSSEGDLPLPRETCLFRGRHVSSEGDMSHPRETCSLPRETCLIRKRLICCSHLFNV
jgi:hypothetical protein